MSTPHTNPLHLYRALLREASYLFHPRVRDFHLNFIKQSFRRQQGKKPIDHDHDHNALSTHPADLPSKHATQQMRRGRKQLYILQRANHGHVKAIENILKSAFARSGKRRREMMKKIMAIPPTDPLAPTQCSPQPVEYGPNWQPPAMFMQLLRSQNKLQRFLSRETGGKIKPLEKIPEKNRWNKPFPVSRIKRIMKKWYAKHASILLPPLDQAEWVEIYLMAHGRVWRSRPRRPLGKVSVFAEAENAQRSLLPVNMARTSPQAYEPQDSKRVRAQIGNPHHLTRRFMRRIARRTLLHHTPTVLANPDSGRLVVRWESGLKPGNRTSRSSTSQDIALFE